ncbi:hypothetical protein ACIBCM_26350 [Streptomyces sp. NPDC051018]|uniref:hypothetical protein n=1 Tax=Streptomyces sp. NPDC051018 TaxID=3365639 RepID=UPI00379423E1
MTVRGPLPPPRCVRTVSFPDAPRPYGLDVVRRVGGVLALMVTGGEELVFWDQATGETGRRRLADPDLPGSEFPELVDMAQIAAASVGGRVVVGGGGDCQAFMLWDGETGEVVAQAEDEEMDVRHARSLQVDGEPVFVETWADGRGVHVWDPSAGAGAKPRWAARDLHSASCAVGHWGDRPVVVGTGEHLEPDSGTHVRDLVTDEPIAHVPGPAGHRNAVVTAGGRTFLVGEHGRALFVHDLDTGDLTGTLPLPGIDWEKDYVERLDTGVAHGRAILAVVSALGTLSLWDLTDMRRIDVPPCAPEEEGTLAVRVTGMDGRPVVVRATHHWERGTELHFWEIPPPRA